MKQTKDRKDQIERLNSYRDRIQADIERKDAGRNRDNDRAALKDHKKA